MSRRKPVFSKADEGKYFITGDAVFICDLVTLEPSIKLRALADASITMTLFWSDAVAQGFTRLLPEKKRAPRKVKETLDDKRAKQNAAGLGLFSRTRKPRSDKGKKRAVRYESFKDAETGETLQRPVASVSPEPATGQRQGEKSGDSPATQPAFVPPDTPGAVYCWGCGEWHEGNTAGHEGAVLSDAVHFACEYYWQLRGQKQEGEGDGNL